MKRLSLESESNGSGGGGGNCDSISGSISGHKSSLDTKLGEMEEHIFQQMKDQIRELLNPTTNTTTSAGKQLDGGGGGGGDKHSNRYKNLKVINHRDLVREREVGRGGFGIVHKGKLGSFDVAIKTVNDEVMKCKSAEKVLDEVKREAMIMQLLESPFVVRFFGVQLDPQYPLAIVMELASCTLDDVLHPLLDLGKFQYRNAIGNEPLSLASKVSVIYSICHALDYMHGFDILHRDIKPLNVLVVDGKPKLSGFGLSKTAGGGGEGSPAFGNGPKGTYSYLAPELFDDDSGYGGEDDGGEDGIAPRTYSQASDVYAFGVTVNEIIAEKKPFHNKADLIIITSMASSKGKERFADLFSTASSSSSLSSSSFRSINSNSNSIDDGSHVSALGGSSDVGVGDSILADLESIIVDCWSTAKSTRPTFRALLKRIERVRLNIEVALEIEKRNKRSDDALTVALAAKQDETAANNSANASNYISTSSNRPLDELYKKEGVSVEMITDINKPVEANNNSNSGEQKKKPPASPSSSGPEEEGGRGGVASSSDELNISSSSSSHSSSIDASNLAPEQQFTPESASSSSAVASIIVAKPIVVTTSVASNRMSNSTPTTSYQESAVATLTGHSTGVFSLAVIGDGERIVSGSDDKTVKIWSSSTGACLQTLKGHTGVVSSVAVIGDGERIVSGNYDRTVKIWSSSSGACLQTFSGHTNWVTSVAVIGDGKRVVSGSYDKTVKIWNSSSGACLQTLLGHTSSVWSVAVIGDGERIVSGSMDSTVKIWSSSSGACIKTLKGHINVVMSVAVIGDGERIVSGSEDKTLKIWSSTSGACLQTLKGHTDAVAFVAVIGDGKRIVSGSMDKTVRIWSSSTGACLQTLRGHTSLVRSVAVIGDGERIVSGSEDKTVKIWSI